MVKKFNDSHNEILQYDGEPSPSKNPLIMGAMPCISLHNIKSSAFPQPHCLPLFFALRKFNSNIQGGCILILNYSHFSYL